MMETLSHLIAVPHHHQAPYHPLQEKDSHLEIHPLRQSLEIHLMRRFHQFHLRTLGLAYHQQGGLYLWVFNILQGPLYRRVLR